MANKFKIKTVSQPICFFKNLYLRLHEGFGLKIPTLYTPQKNPIYLVVLEIVWCAYVGGSWMSFSGKKAFYHQQIRVKRRNHANFERDDNVPEIRKVVIEEWLAVSSS